MGSDSASVRSKIATKLSPWVTLNEKRVARGDTGEIDVFHSFQQSDYVTILAIRPDGLIPIVKQFRPALERKTFEFPGGLIDRLADPETLAESELYEETGHKITGRPHLLGCLYPDTSRLENRFWAFFGEASSDIDSNWTPEVGVDLTLVSKNELRGMINNGHFNHAQHLGLVGLALTKGFFSW